MWTRRSRVCLIVLAFAVLTVILAIGQQISAGTSPPANWPWLIDNLCYPTIGNPAIVQKGTSFTFEFDCNGKASGATQPDLFTNETYPYGIWDVYLRTSEINDPWRTIAPMPAVVSAVKGTSQAWPAGSGPWGGKQVWRVTVTIASNTRPGLYDLDAQVMLGDYSWVNDSQYHCISVVDQYKDSYNYCQLSDFHINDPRGPGDLLGVVPGPHPNWAEFDPYNYGGPAPHFRYNTRAIDDINNISPDFVIMTGDMAFGCPFYTESPFPVTGITDYTGFEAGYPPESFPWNGEFYWAYQHLLRLRVPVVLVPGNHDTYNLDSIPEHTGQDGKDVWPTWFGPLYFGWDYGNKLHFTNVWSYDKPPTGDMAHSRGFWELIYWLPPTNPDGKVDTAQLNWVQQDLASSKAQSASMLAMAMHHPFYGINKGWDDTTSENAMLQYSRQYGVRLVLSGHTHEDSVDEDTTGGAQVLHANTTTTSFGCNGYPGFRRIIVADSAITPASICYKIGDAGDPHSYFSYPTYSNAIIGYGKEADVLKAEIATYNQSALAGTFSSSNPNVTDKTYTLTNYYTTASPSVTISDTIVYFLMAKLNGHDYTIINGTLIDSWDTDATHTIVRARMNPIAPGQTSAMRVVALPYITSLDPVSGAPGIPVTISGENLGSSGTVLFGEVEADTNSWSDTEITATVPDMGNGQVDVTVENERGISNGVPFTVTGSGVLPHINSLNPSAGVPGDEITIGGSAFGVQGASSKVLFGDSPVEATILDWSDLQIKARVPGIANGVRAVRVRNSVGTSNSIDFTVYGPNIDTLTPQAGTVGTEVAIDGTHFGARDSSCKVFFASTEATINSWSDTRIEALVPGMGDGSVVVKVRNGTGDSNTDKQFTINSALAPHINDPGGLTPASGVAGSPVTISGDYFGAYSSGTCKVYFGTTQASVQSWYNDTIATLVPGIGSGPVQVYVENENGESNGVTFTVDDSAPPYISSLGPNPVKSSQALYVYGSNFGAAAETSEVRLDGSAYPHVSWGGSLIRIYAPATPADYSVTVVTEHGESNAVTLHVEAHPNPYISLLTPGSGGPDRLVSIYGEYFGTQGSASRVYFATTRATVEQWSDTRIRARVPDGLGIGDVDVTVRTGNGTSNAYAFTLTDQSPPIIESIKPSSGRPGTTVTIRGRHFLAPDSESGVQFGNTRATVTGWSDSVVTTRVPTLAPGAVAMNLTTRYGNASKTFTVIPDVVRTPTWYLAEGSSDWGFDTYVNIQNPNSTAVTAAVTYMTPGGSVPRADVTLAPKSQVTINPRNDIGVKDFSTKVSCKEGKTICVDRRMLWQGAGAPSQEGHSSVGVTAAAKTWYLPEGSSKWGFECWLLIQNPNATSALCDITYMVEGAGPTTRRYDVPARSRRSFDMSNDIGAADASIKVESSVPVIPERAMYRYGRSEGHVSIGTTAPAKDYYLAEGTTDWGFTTYVLVQNPNAGKANVSVTFMTESGPVAMPRFGMESNSRKTIRVNDVLPGKDCSTWLHADKPIIAERAMYWNGGTGGGEACHDSIGMPSAHKTFYMPDGETQNGHETWTLVQNPDTTRVGIRVTYMRPDGSGNIVFNDTLEPKSRKSYNMADELGTGKAAVMVECTTSGKGIMCERAMYWNGRGAGTDTIGGYSD